MRNMRIIWNIRIYSVLVKLVEVIKVERSGPAGMLEEEEHDYLVVGGTSAPRHDATHNTPQNILNNMVSAKVFLFLLGVI